MKEVLDELAAARRTTGAATLPAGGDPDHVAAAVEATTASYAPDGNAR